MRLNGPQIERLQSALVAAYPDAADFDMFLDLKLSRKRPTLTVANDLLQRAYDVITKAEAQGWTADLIRALAAERGVQLPQVQALCDELLPFAAAWASRRQRGSRPHPHQRRAAGPAPGGPRHPAGRDPRGAGRPGQRRACWCCTASRASARASWRASTRGATPRAIRAARSYSTPAPTARPCSWPRSGASSWTSPTCPTLPLKEQCLHALATLSRGAPSLLIYDNVRDLDAIRAVPAVGGRAVPRRADDAARPVAAGGLAGAAGGAAGRHGGGRAGAVGRRRRSGHGGGRRATGGAGRRAAGATGAGRSGVEGRGAARPQAQAGRDAGGRVQLRAGLGAGGRRRAAGAVGRGPAQPAAHPRRRAAGAPGGRGPRRRCD